MVIICKEQNQLLKKSHRIISMKVIQLVENFQRVIEGKLMFSLIVVLKTFPLVNYIQAEYILLKYRCEWF